MVFESDTTNWVAGGNNFTDIFLKDRADGTLTRISTSLTGTDGNGESRYAKISADGRFVVFQSDANNLTAGDTNGYHDVFVWDREDGSLTNLSSLMGTPLNPNTGCFNPDVAFDGAFGGVIVFETGKRLVAEDTYNNTDIYAYNMYDDTFQLVSSPADGTGI